MIIDHLDSSLTSQAIHIQITEWQTEGRKNTFRLQAHVGERLIATAQHSRFVVNVERFLENVHKINRPGIRGGFFC